MKILEIGYHNEVIKEYKLIKKGCLENLDSFVLEGTWFYEKIINKNILVEKLIICPDLIKSELEGHIIDSLSTMSKSVYKVSQKTMNRIVDKENQTSLAIICKQSHNLKSVSKVLILDGLENPGNIGTIFRSCDGAGYDAVYIVNQKARINQHRVIKSSMGGCLSVPWVHFSSIDSLLTELKQSQLQVILAHPGEHTSLASPKRYALVVGNERYGLSKKWFEHKHQTISIPMLGSCDSLNVGVAASILMYKLIE